MPRKRSQKERTAEPPATVPLEIATPLLAEAAPAALAEPKIEAEPPPPPASPPHEPARRPKAWAETVRPWENYPESAVRRVETKAPDMTGLQFARDRKRTDAEKPLLDEHELRYYSAPEAWLKKATPDARDETKTLTRRIAQGRIDGDGKGR